MVGGDKCGTFVEGEDCVAVKQAGGTRQCTGKKKISKEEKFWGEKQNHQKSK